MGHDARDSRVLSVVVKSSRPGSLVVKHRNDPFGKFVNVAVLEGDQIKIVDEGFSTQPDARAR